MLWIALQVGYSTGGFVRAILQNDLFLAVAKADGYSFFCLKAICEYVYNFTPGPCWGSKKKVKAWMDLHKEKPAEAEKIAAGDRNKRRDYV